MNEKTGRQDTSVAGVFVYTGEAELPKTSAITDTKRREIRADPTVSLSRTFAVAPILISNWSVTADDDVPDSVVDFIRKQVLDLKLPFLEHALFGGIDFGWAPFEVVYGVAKGHIVVKKLKPLLQDLTTILIDGKTGAFAGFKQTDLTIVPVKRALLITFRTEGTMWYGNSLIDNAAVTYDTWDDANAGAKRYDKKLAGSHFMVYYPPGKSLDDNGAEVENSEMAKVILRALESSGSVAVPRTILEHIEDLNKDQQAPYEWKIEIIEDKSGRQPTFIARLRYLDVLKVRAMGMPERTVTEGSHGTLAEASAHIDLSLTNMDFVHAHVLLTFNSIITDTLLKQNWGNQYLGKLRVVPSSLVDERKAYLQKLYITLLSNMRNLPEAESIDLDSVKDFLGIPKAASVTPIGKGLSNAEGNSEDEVDGDK